MYRDIEAAIADGRIPESSRGEYEALMSRQPRQTKKFLKGLPPTLNTEPEEPSVFEDEDYPTVGLTPRERERVSASRNPRQAVAASATGHRAAMATQAASGAPFKGPAYPQEWLSPKERAALSADRPSERGNITFDV